MRGEKEGERERGERERWVERGGGTMVEIQREREREERGALLHKDTDLSRIEFCTNLPLMTNRAKVNTAKSIQNKIMKYCGKIKYK